MNNMLTITPGVQELRRLAAGMRGTRADIADMLERISAHPVDAIELDVILRVAESALRYLRIESEVADRPAPVWTGT